MYKKYFAMTIIAASVSLAACSSDDDDDGVVTPPVVTGAEGTAYDLIATSGEHVTLLGLIDGAGDLASTLDGEDAVFTVFAPTDDAFTAYSDLVAAGLATTDDDSDDMTALEDFSEAQVSRILLNHVVSGSVANPLEDLAVLNTLAVADDTVDPALVAQTLTVGIDANGDTSVTPIGGEAAMVTGSMTGEEADAAEQDVVYSVGAVLLPSDLPADDVVSGGGDGGVTSSGVTDTFANLVGGDYTIAVAALDSAFGADTFETAPWTLFLPSDAVLAAQDPAISELDSAAIRGHLVTEAYGVDRLNAATGTNLTTANDGLEPAGDPNSLAVLVEGDTTTVGGFAVTHVGSIIGDGTNPGGQVYSIAGPLPAVTAAGS